MQGTTIYSGSCSLVHFEIRIKIRTGYKARLWICAHVHGCLLSINKTGSCMYCILLPILNVLLPPQVGVFPPHVSSGAVPPVSQHSSLQPVEPQVCMCIAHVCVGVGGGDGCVHVRVYLNKTNIISLSSQWSLLVPPQAGAFPAHVFRGVSQPFHQLSSDAQPVQTTPLRSQQTQVFVWVWVVGMSCGCVFGWLSADCAR